MLCRIGMNSPSEKRRAFGTSSRRVGLRSLIPWLTFGLCFPLSSPAFAGDISVYLTCTKLDKRLHQEAAVEWSADSGEADVVITLRPDVTHQEILGLGSSLEPTTCFNIHALTPEDREEVVTKLVDPVDGIGMNLMRLCIGTPDFTGDPWYSYCDVPKGEVDPELKNFSIDNDRAYILPVIKAVAKANPNCLFFASPWSPPGWMTTTDNMIGGKLKPEWYAAYADYFVRYIKAYEAEGVPIYAVTVQNEPGVDRNLEEDPKWYYPSCRWSGAEERDFIRDHLGPALRKAGLKTKIWCYDHNYNTAPTPDGDDPGLDYPRTILKDPKAALFVDGVALHGYAGKPANMLLLKKEYPQVPLHFTEGSVFKLFGLSKLVAILENGATSYNAWVTMSDTEGEPNNGPFEADTTCIQRDLAMNEPIYTDDYYFMGHFMKFIPRGSVRIGTESSRRLAHLAFRTNEGSYRVVLVNFAARAKDLRIELEGQSAVVRLPGAAVMTLAWNNAGS